jgi:hypothetical protein
MTAILVSELHTAHTGTILDKFPDRKLIPVIVDINSPGITEARRLKDIFSSKISLVHILNPDGSIDNMCVDTFHEYTNSKSRSYKTFIDTFDEQASKYIDAEKSNIASKTYQDDAASNMDNLLLLCDAYNIVKVRGSIEAFNKNIAEGFIPPIQNSDRFIILYKNKENDDAQIIKTLRTSNYVSPKTLCKHVLQDFPKDLDIRPVPKDNEQINACWGKIDGSTILHYHVKGDKNGASLIDVFKSIF